MRLRRRIDHEQTARRAVERERDRLLLILEGRAGSATLRATVAKRMPEGYGGRCAYCGAHARGRVCAEHRDLVALDPHYAGQ